MRKTAITILFAIISSIILNSCNGKAGFSQSENDSITFDSVKVDSTLFLTEDTAGPRCHVDISITYAKGKNADYINDS
ncbi:MAG: hypothetical protein Q4D41_06505, partial [Prevotellaceae bacterium]|nr:hypothetical protein [Prevotellaceae bacterium]